MQNINKFLERASQDNNGSSCSVYLPTSGRLLVGRLFSYIYNCGVVTQKEKNKNGQTGLNDLSVAVALSEQISEHFLGDLKRLEVICC